MDSAAKIAELPPLYYEARRYCEDHDLPAEEIGRVREWMAVREFRQRVEPYYRQAARIMNLVPGYTFDGQGYVRANLTLEQDKMLEQIQQLIDREAETLGLGARRQAARGQRGQAQGYFSGIPLRSRMDSSPSFPGKTT